MNAISPRALFRDRGMQPWSEPFPGEQVTLHVDSERTGGKFACGEALLQPGVGQPLHIHHNIDELLYVVAGRIDFALEGQRYSATAGGFVFIPQGSVHGFRNLSDSPARMLGVFSPSGFDGIFAAMNGQPPEAFPEIARRFGIEVVGPLLEPLAG